MRKKGRACASTSWVLAALEEKELKYLDVLVHSSVLAPEARTYNAGFTTNCAACISKYSEMHGLISAGPLLVSGEYILGAALVSADRFYSYFKVMPNELIIRHSMEDKRVYKIRSIYWSASYWACLRRLRSF